MFLCKGVVYNVKKFSANVGGGGFIVWGVIPDNVTSSLFLGCSIGSCAVLIVFKYMFISTCYIYLIIAVNL